MNKQEAHAILNAAKAGFPISRWHIGQALIATGDLDPAKHAEPEEIEVPCGVSHVVPHFSPEDRGRPKKEWFTGPPKPLALPKIVFQPFEAKEPPPRQEKEKPPEIEEVKWWEHSVSKPIEEEKT